MTDFYEWGPWVNGGAWVQTTYGKVDLIFRSIDDVDRTISEAKAGIHHRHYEQQPAHGFYSVIYLAETRDCWAVYDPDEIVLRLKGAVRQYPARLRKAIVNEALWAAQFSLYVASGFAQRGDVYNATGCFTRVAAYLTQVVFALNETYFAGDKSALETIDGFATAPAAYGSRVAEILACPGGSADQLSASLASMRALWQEVAHCAGSAYTAKYPLPPA